jgi:hypothetical protein
LRFIGTIVGVAAVAIWWDMVHLDYRLLPILTVLIVASMLFFMALPYNHFMIIGTLFSDTLLEWGNSSYFNLQYYIVDRIICVLITFCVCIVLEQLWFGAKNMTKLNIVHLRTEIIQDLDNLYLHLTQHNLLGSLAAKKNILILHKLERLVNLVADAKLASSQLDQVKFDQLVVAIRSIQRQLSALAYLKNYRLAIDEQAVLTRRLDQELTCLKRACCNDS